MGVPLGRAGESAPWRWTVERTFAWVGDLRRLLVRHERLIGAYRGLMCLALVPIYLVRISE